MRPSIHFKLLSWILSFPNLILAATAPGTPCSGDTASILHPGGSIEIFFSGSDGRVYSSLQNSDSTSFSEPKSIGTIRVAPCSPVSAISASEGSLDIFVTGDDKPVHSASRQSDGNFSPWVQLAGGEAKAGTLITPVTTGGKVYVFWVGTDGITYETELRGGNNTANVINTNSIGAGNQITVLPRFENPNTVDLLSVTANKHIYHMNFEAADETGTWTDLSYPGDLGAEPGAPVSAVILDNGDLHLFVSALDGQIWTSVRTQSPATPFSAWTLTGELVVPISAPIFGIKTAANTIELFVTGQDSLVYMSTWNGGFSLWEVVSGVSTVGGAPITGVSVSDTEFHMFVTGLNKNVSTIEWSVGMSRDCSWWGVGADPVSCTKKAGDESEGVSVATSSGQIAGKDKKGQYIGIGVAIGLLVGISVMGGVGFWLYKRWNGKLREKNAKADEVNGYAPAELSCGPPAELPESDSGNSEKTTAVVEVYERK